MQKQKGIGTYQVQPVHHIVFHTEHSMEIGHKMLTIQHIFRFMNIDPNIIRVIELKLFLFVVSSCARFRAGYSGPRTRRCSSTSSKLTRRTNRRGQLIFLFHYLSFILSFTLSISLQFCPDSHCLEVTELISEQVIVFYFFLQY